MAEAVRFYWRGREAGIPLAEIPEPDRNPLRVRRRVVQASAPDVIRQLEEGRFVAELLELIRQRCSATLAKDTSPQGFWIKDFSSLPVLDKYLSGGVLKIFPGEAAPDQPWIQIFP